MFTGPIMPFKSKIGISVINVKMSQTRLRDCKSLCSKERYYIDENFMARYKLG